MPGGYGKFVFSTNDQLDATCDISDEVERLYGFGCTVVSLGGHHTKASTLYIDSRYPTWEAAYAYARELYAAARESREAYRAALR